MTTILLVEDNEMNRDMLSRRLVRKGYEVITASDGYDGLNAARANMPDLILMDINLPVIDGWQVTKELKSSEITQSIPIIALTAYATLVDREKSIEAGCDEFDTKPVDLQRLITKIEKLLNDTD